MPTSPGFRLDIGFKDFASMGAPLLQDENGTCAVLI
jgi:hypothetical protein